jgi:hypothetical protein
LKSRLINSDENSILYNLRGSSLHIERTKALTQVICPGDFRVAWSFFCTGDVFILYVKFEKKPIIFTSLPLKHHLINSNANLFLYNLRGSSLHMKRPKALTQGTCPGGFGMARSFSGDLLFLYIKCIHFREKDHYFEQKPFDQFKCKFDFLQLERVFLAHEKA